MLRNGLYFNDVFGAVIALSSALITDEEVRMKPGTDNFMAPYEYCAHTFGESSTLLITDRAPKTLAKLRKEAGETLPRLFLTCGTKDFPYPVNLDMHKVLTVFGIPVSRHPRFQLLELCPALGSGLGGEKRAGLEQLKHPHPRSFR